MQSPTTNYAASLAPTIANSPSYGTNTEDILKRLQMLQMMQQISAPSDTSRYQQPAMQRGAWTPLTFNADNLSGLQNVGSPLSQYLFRQ